MMCFHFVNIFKIHIFILKNNRFHEKGVFSVIENSFSFFFSVFFFFNFLFQWKIRKYVPLLKMKINNFIKNKNISRLQIFFIEKSKPQFIIFNLISYIYNNLIIEYLFYFIQKKNYHEKVILLKQKIFMLYL
jgi:hypothetical protein